MSCKLTTWQLLQRRQYLRYQGLPTVAVNAYPYVLSGTVPLSKYWIVFWLSLLSGKAAQTVSQPFELYLIPTGATLPQLAAGTVPDDPFFLNYQGQVSKAAGPGAYGLRIDRFNLGSTGDFDLPSRQGDEVQMIDRPLIVGPGETLMGWCQQFALGPTNPSVLEMRLVIAQMDQSENVPLRF